MPPTTIARVPRVLALVDAAARHRLAEPIRAGFDAMVASVLEGRVGYCEHEPLWRRTPTRREHCSIACSGSPTRPTTSTCPPTTSCTSTSRTANVLSVDGEAITGVIDWEGTTTGDAAFDLVTHALYTYDLDAARRVARLLLPIAPTHASLPLYAAHMVLRQVELVAAQPRTTSRVRWWLDLGTALLDAVGAG